MQDIEKKSIWDPFQRTPQGVHPGIHKSLVHTSSIPLHLFPIQGRQEEELVMAKTKVSEIAKKLAAVKPDSIVLKNKEPRSVMMIVVAASLRSQCPLFRRRRCLVRDLRQLQLCWISWLEFALIWKLVFKRNGKGKS